jgi:hypothetical protein
LFVVALVGSGCVGLYLRPLRAFIVTRASFQTERDLGFSLSFWKRLALSCIHLPILFASASVHCFVSFCLRHCCLMRKSGEAKNIILSF